MRRRIPGISIAAAALFAPIFVMFGVWWPYIDALPIGGNAISEETVSESRRFPDSYTFDYLKNLEFGEIEDGIISVEYKKLSDDILGGNFRIEGYAIERLGIPFDASAVEKGGSNWQLAYSGFMIPNIFLKSYMETKDPKYLRAALDFILGWSEFERTYWSLDSFVWNDHAVASRASVLSTFWYYYKDDESFDVEDARKVLETASRAMNILSRDVNYTFRTNHGTMQNLAALKLSLFFPKLRYAKKLSDNSIRNIIEQFKYYINKEGVVIEHSSEYHEFGMKLFSTAFRLFDLIHADIPPDWREKYERGVGFLAALRRPDGSLPRFGDTNSGKGRASNLSTILMQGIAGNSETAELSRRPMPAFTFVPQAGYAVWWEDLNSQPHSRDFAQLSVTWSYFPFMGHKHADELSLNLWAAGQEWWTSVGYWPYTDRRRNAAISWSGSNAPHVIGEPADSERKSVVLAYLDKAEVKGIDLVRQGAGGFEVRRQIFGLNNGVWVVLDSFKDNAERQGRVVWGLHPALRYEAREANRAVKVVGSSNSVMDVFFEGPVGMTIRRVQGAEKPMAGWFASGQNILPAGAFIVDQGSGDGWLATVFNVRAAGEEKIRSVDVQWSDPNNWAVDIIRSGGGLKIGRVGDDVAIGVTAADAPNEKFPLSKADMAGQSQTEIADQYYGAEQKHGERFVPLLRYRGKVSFLLLFLFVINGVLIYYFRKKIVHISTASIVSHLLLYLWLTQIYLVV